MCNVFVPSPPLSVQLHHIELSSEHCPQHPTVCHFLFCLLNCTKLREKFKYWKEGGNKTERISHRCCEAALHAAAGLRKEK